MHTPKKVCPKFSLSVEVSVNDAGIIQFVVLYLPDTVHFVSFPTSVISVVDFCSYPTKMLMKELFFLLHSLEHLLPNTLEMLSDSVVNKLDLLTRKADRSVV